MSSHGIKDQVAIVGMGCAPFREHWDKGLDDLLIDATADAFESAGNTDPVPFPFGYNWRKEGRSGVIVARRPGGDT